MAVGKKSSHKNASRSRQLIKQAFAQLLNEKDMAKITVTDIVERAGISRGTFYAHYLDVYDLHIAIQNNMMETIDNTLNTVGIDNIMRDPSDAIRIGLKFLQENKDYYKLFVNSKDGPHLIERVISIVQERFSDRIGELTTQNNAKIIMCYLIYTLGGIRSLLIDWFNQSVNISADDCANLLIQYVNSSRPKELLDLIELLPKTEE